VLCISKLQSGNVAGSYAGAVLGMPLSGILTDYWGWEACFYVYGKSNKKAKLSLTNRAILKQTLAGDLVIRALRKTE